MEVQNDLMTIKEFASASGRSQQTIYKQINTRLSDYLHEIEGQKFIEKRALSDVFRIGVQPDENNSFNPKDNHVEQLYVMLQAELDSKNKQIEQLQNDLAKEREHSREISDKLAQLADQAQRLHAGTIKQIPEAVSMESQEIETSEVVEPVGSKRLTFWEKIKHFFG